MRSFPPHSSTATHLSMQQPNKKPRIENEHKAFFMSDRDDQEEEEKKQPGEDRAMPHTKTAAQKIATRYKKAGAAANVHENTANVWRQQVSARGCTTESSTQGQLLMISLCVKSVQELQAIHDAIDAVKGTGRAPDFSVLRCVEVC